jgi:hypothetical protein
MRPREKEGKEDSTRFSAFLLILTDKYILKYQILETTSNEDKTSYGGRVQEKLAQTKMNMKHLILVNVNHTHNIII